jgi:hypothetical protein
LRGFFREPLPEKASQITKISMQPFESRRQQIEENLAKAYQLKAEIEQALLVTTSPTEHAKLRFELEKVDQRIKELTDEYETLLSSTVEPPAIEPNSPSLPLPPYVSNKQQAWLDARQFKAKPFWNESCDAEADDNLTEYFIPRKVFEQFQESFHATYLKIYFAPSGLGKSATVRAIESNLNCYGGLARVQAGPSLVVIFDEAKLTGVLEDNDIAAIQNLRRDLYEKHLHQAIIQTWQDRGSSITANYNLQSGKLEHPDLYSCCRHLKKIGIKNIVVLLDSVDRVMNSGLDFDNSQQQVFISNLIFYSNQIRNNLVQSGLRLCFHFFLPHDFRTAMTQNQRIRRAWLDNTDWTWDEAELNLLLEERLRFYRYKCNTSTEEEDSFGDNDEVPIPVRLAELCQVSDIELRLIKAAEGSPRNLIRLGYFLMEEDRKEFEYNQSMLISEQSLRNALRRFRAESVV